MNLDALSLKVLAADLVGVLGVCALNLASAWLADALTVPVDDFALWSAELEASA